MNTANQTNNQIVIFDTTLRDGAQTAGIEFSLEDKISICGLLEQLGVDYIEGGYPGANPTDTAFFATRRTRDARFVAFGMTIGIVDGAEAVDVHGHQDKGCCSVTLCSRLNTNWRFK